MTESYVRGGNAPPLLEITIGQALDLAATIWPEQDALVCPAQAVRMSWHDLRVRAETIAAGLLAMGLKPGDRIGIWSLNRPEWTLTQFAAAKAGLILVTINPAYRLSELEYALNKVGLRRARHRHALQDQQLHGDARTRWRRNWPNAAAGRAACGAAAAAARGDPDRRAGLPGTISFLDK